MTKNLKILAVLLVASLTLVGCFGKKKINNTPVAGTSAEPDKVLYDRALEDIRKGRHGVGRLTLQTLINTYPDSEYLAKAKLAIADSYFKEGGTAGLTQSVAEYKDFITFFPFLDEAAYAQMQLGMAHYRRMEKPDRDRSEGRLAEEEFQIFLQKYPNHALTPQAEQRLREVQEVLAEGDFRIAHFYYVKGSPRASAARLMEMTSRYPLYSQADKALWMLGSLYERSEKGDIAAQFYSRIVREYPLSGLVDDCKARLVKLGVPVPQPDAEALARMQHEREVDRKRPGLLRRSMGALRTGPNVAMAAQTGKPNLAPPTETTPGTEILAQGSKPTVGTSAGGTSAGGNTTYVERVTPAPPGSTPPNASPAAGSALGTTPPAAGAENPPKPDSSSPEVKPPTDPSQASDNKDKKSDQDKKDDHKKKKESSSKKKKRLRKLIPW